MQSLLKRVVTSILLSSTFFTFSFLPALAAVTYTYDANGNMSSDGTNCYSYDDSNELIQVRDCTNGQLKGEYVYDDQGNRIIQKIYTNGVLSQTVYTPTKSFEASKDASSSSISNTTYYDINNQIVARKNPDGSKTFYNNDNLGSSNVLTNQSGQLVEKTTYYPFGGIQSGGTQSKFLYTGQKRDSETGLDYYNARYYNDQISRFTQPDDIVQDLYNPQSLNRYSYVGNNPLRYIDPSGHFSISSLISSIASIFSKPAPKPASTYVLPSNNVFKNTKVNLSNTDGNLPAMYTKESFISNTINKSLSVGHIEVQAGTTVGIAGASLGVKYGNQGQATFGSLGVGPTKLGLKYGGSIIFSPDPYKEKSFDSSVDIDFVLAAQFGFDIKDPLNYKKWQFGGIGFGCCGVDASTSYTEKTRPYDQPVPQFYSKNLEDFYEK
jgi:RHS repeat-associated protein